MGPSTKNVKRGRGAERHPRQIRRENLCRVEPHERQWREIEPYWPWEESKRQEAEKA